MGLPGTGRMLAIAGGTAAATILVDQLTKGAAREAFAPGETRDLAFDGEVSVGHVRNFGSSYGIVGEMPVWVPALATGLLGAGLLAFGRGSKAPTTAGIGAGLVIGGGIGNVIDRARQGHVTDFMHTSDLFNSSNVADVAVVGGLATAGAALLLAR